MATYLSGVRQDGVLGVRIEVPEIEDLAKGDVIAGDGVGGPSIVTVGADATVLTADAAAGNGVKWAVPGVNGWIDDGGTVRLATALDNVIMGADTGSSGIKLEVRGFSGTSIGGFPSGALHVTSNSASVNSNAVITGHNLFGGNKQLWYIGSTSSSNDNIGIINRQNGNLTLSTNATTRMTIGAGGEVGIGGGAAASAIFDVTSTSKGARDPRWTDAQETTNVAALVAGDQGLKWFNTTTKEFKGWDGTAVVILISAPFNSSINIDWDGDATGPTEVIVGDMLTIELPDAAVKGVVSDHIVSSTIDLNTDPVLTVRFVVTTTGAESQNVVLRLTTRYIAASSELVTKAADEVLTNTVFVLNIANQLHTTNFTLSKALIAVSDSVTFGLQRLGTDASDLFTGNIGIEEHSRVERDVL